MATASRIELSPATTGVFNVPDLRETSAYKSSQVLQGNHEKHHCFFNNDGFHNHIPHHILTLYALGATPDEIQRGYDVNAEYQRSPGKEKKRVLDDLHDRKKITQYLGKQQYYASFLHFFQSEIEEKGVGGTIQDHLFAGDEVANRMLGQMFAGFLHPIIHAGFGIEFEQPAIVAEGLSMCAVSSSWLNKYFEAIGLHISSSTSSPTPSSKSLFDILTEIQSNADLTTCAKWSDSNKILDGVLARASQPMVQLVSQFRVTKPPDLTLQTAEMTSFSAYITCAALNPTKQIKFDFFFMHCINSSIFFWSFLDQPWLTNAQKCKLLEMKGWVDLCMYVSRGSPKLYLEEITNYEPKVPGDWTSLFRRINKFEDDGHASKFIRALANGEIKCKEFEEKWPIRGNMWLKMAHMVIDSVEAENANWARSVGFPEAWEGFADRK